jgi:signal transduction histidine kinase
MNAEFEREARQRILMTLLGVNLVILGLAGVGGYFLAGMSLQPIKLMIDEQHRFITDASHELRTPLTVLKSEIEVSLRDKNMTLAETRKILESNLEEVNNLQILTDNLLELASYQQKTLRDTFRTVGINDIMNDAMKAVYKAAKQKSITIKNEMTDQFVKGNEMSLTRLFIILLDNAIKYSPEKSTVTITEKRIDGHVRVKVADQGIGIDSKDIPKVFHRFYRSNSARTKTQAAGYGLGLSIAKKIVENHNGSIKVESEKDKGTTFIVSLPVDN